jgi:predicted Zn-dependent protease
MISTERRVEYAQGFLTLGLVEEAAEELDHISPADRDQDAVLEVMIDLHSMRERWDLAVSAAERYTQRHPDEPKGWISWAFALRRWKTIAEAESILLQAEQRIGETCALVHYNLACYRCQQSDLPGALQRLSIACRMDRHWKTAALKDPDLAPLKNEIKALAFD